MKNTIWVLIEAGNNEVKGVLAAEALEAGATARSVALETEIRAQGRLVSAFSAAVPVAGDRLLVVGDAKASVSLAALPHLESSLEQVLADAGAVLDALLQKKSAPAAETSSPVAGPKRIVAVTACPTGIAHTFMAAEGLMQAAAALGHSIRVETQGSVGVGTPLTPEEISQSDLVIIAAEREVERSRFGGKLVFVSDTKQAISDGQNFINRAFIEATTQAKTSRETPTAAHQEKRAGPYKHLMTGVSFMLPFVVAGGLLISLAFALGGIRAGDAEGTLGAVLMMVGAKGGFALMVPVLAGYIAYSIADRPGIAPGMIGGMLCSILGAGFLGGIAAGFIGGYSTAYINRLLPLPKNLAGLKPVLILPLFGTLVTALSIYYVIGGPVANLNAFLREWLNGLQGTSSLVVGLLLGGMMALDMGGPVNKAAYAFATGLLEGGVYTPMAAVMAAGMVPPLAAALASRLFKSKFTFEERESSGATFVLGLSFITEGAIPYAARDPLRVIPSFVIGSAVTGAISMWMGIKLMAPHGGVFVLLIPNAVSNVGVYVLAIAIGAVVAALLMGILKKRVPV